MYLLYISTDLLIYVYIYIHIDTEGGHTSSVIGYRYSATSTNDFSTAERPFHGSPALGEAQPRLRAAEHPSPTGKGEPILLPITTGTEGQKQNHPFKTHHTY